MSKNDRARPYRKACRVAVIGGGISGLAAANRVFERCPDAELTLVEARDRLGGALLTKHIDGFLVEHGADNFITTPSYAVDLCERIGFGQELIKTNPEHRRAFVVRKGKLEPIPQGFMVMAPSRIGPILRTPILSWRGKLRMAGEAILPRATTDSEESLAKFVRRRFGREVYERLVQPLVAGIYTGDPERLSVGATMPRFLQMEKEHGSLIRAIWKQRNTQRSTAHKSSGARYSQFVAPRGGMSALVQALNDRLADATVLLQSPVEHLDRTDSGWRISIGGVEHCTINVDGVVLATPAHYSAALLQEVNATLASELAQINYGSCALVSLGFRREQISHPLDGFGLVAPAIEGRQILSCSFTSVKYTDRAADGKVLLRAFVGGALQSDLVELDDEKLQELVVGELADLLAIRGKPEFCHITRQRRAMPQYYVGHESRARHIEQQAAKLPNFALAGNALHGIGVPNCIHTGEQAAERVLTGLSPMVQKRGLGVAVSSPSFPLT